MRFEDSGASRRALSNAVASGLDECSLRPLPLRVRFQEMCGKEKPREMDPTAADHPEENTTARKAQAKPEQHPSAEHSVDKFADARRAKKKEKRKRHRARLRRPHTDG